MTGNAPGRRGACFLPHSQGGFVLSKVFTMKEMMWHHEGFIREARAFDSLWLPDRDGLMKTGEQSSHYIDIDINGKGTACQTTLGP